VHSERPSALPYVAVTVAVLLLGILLLRTAWVADDAYISFRTVHNFLEGHGLRWNVAERVQSYTHPLWLLVVTLFAGCGLDPAAGSLIASGLLTLGIPVLIASRDRFGAPAAVFAVVLMASSKSIMDFSVSGLENPLTNALLVGWLIVLLEGERDGAWRRESEPTVRLVVLALLAALLATTRLDTALITAPAILVVLIRCGVYWSVPRILIGALPLFAWEIFSLIYYGDLVPNTARAKLGFEADAGIVLTMGLEYLTVSLGVDPVLWLLLIAGCGVAVLDRTACRASAGLGAVTYVGYIVRAGGDFMVGRFLVAPAIVMIVLMVTSSRFAMPGRVATGSLAVLLSLLSPASSLRTGPDYGRVEHHVGAIFDERGFYYQLTGVLAAPASDDGDRNTRVPLSWDGGRVHILVGQGGRAPYQDGPGVHYVDPLALTDPLLARIPVVAEGPFRPGHLNRRIPTGYLESLRTGENLILDRRVATLYDDVELVSQGPLWTVARWQAICRLLFLGPGT
jgi:arabinofuranosyltransferase